MGNNRVYAVPDLFDHIIIIINNNKKITFFLNETLVCVLKQNTNILGSDRPHKNDALGCYLMYNHHGKGLVTAVSNNSEEK